MRIKRILAIILLCASCLVCMTGCGDRETYIAKINGQKYYIGTQFSTMLKNSTVETSQDALELNTGESSIVRVNDKNHNTYFVCVYNDSDDTINIENCWISYIRVIDFYLTGKGSVSFDQFTLQSSFKKLTKELGEYQEFRDNGSDAWYLWFDNRLATCARIDKETNQIEEVIRGEASAVVNLMRVESN